MTPENFVYWLQGYFELLEDAEAKGLSAKQAKMIKEHLELVFEKVTHDGSDASDNERKTAKQRLKELWDSSGGAFGPRTTTFC